MAWFVSIHQNFTFVVVKPWNRQNVCVQCTNLKSYSFVLPSNLASIHWFVFFPLISPLALDEKSKISANVNCFIYFKLSIIWNSLYFSKSMKHEVIPTFLALSCVFHKKITVIVGEPMFLVLQEMKWRQIQFYFQINGNEWFDRFRDAI